MFSGRQSGVSQIKPRRPMRNGAVFVLRVRISSKIRFVTKILQGAIVCFGVRDEGRR